LTRRRKGNRAGFGFDDDHQTQRCEPCGDVCSHARLCLEGGDAVGNALIVNHSRTDAREIVGGAESIHVSSFIGLVAFRGR
jgi:hypothetical protein